MHNCYLLAAVAYCLFEPILGDAPAACATIDPGANRERLGVVADGDEVLEGNIKTLEILAHYPYVDIFVAPTIA